MDETEDPAASVSSLPATMADIFLALVAVVVMMLLSLSPAIRTPGALAAPAAFDVWRDTLLVDGSPATVVVAEQGGLRLTKPAERLVPLDGILDDTDLAAVLRDGAGAPGGLLLVIREQGQEAAFLFEALASSLGIDALNQLRLDRDCSYVVETTLAAECRRAPAGSRS